MMIATTHAPQELFEAACRATANDPHHTPKVDLTLPAKKSPSAAERATWRRTA